MIRKRAILFDVGETLVERPDVGPGRRIADALGLDANAARAITKLVFRTKIAAPAELAALLREQFGLTVDPTPAVAAIWDAQLEEPREIPGATACLRAVHHAGAKIGIVSNIWAPYAAGFRRVCADIVPLVESWQLSFEVGTAKPDQTLLQNALATLEVAPEHATMVGDSLEKDVVPALALGMGAVWLKRDPDALPDVPVPAGCRVARDLGEVRRILLTGLWSARGAAAALTGPLPAGRTPA